VKGSGTGIKDLGNHGLRDGLLGPTYTITG